LSVAKGLWREDSPPRSTAQLSSAQKSSERSPLSDPIQ
jgi:hypothetical protein